MDYDLLTQDEMDDMLVQTMRGQQLDHFMHTVNLQRYETMLPGLPDGEFKQRMERLTEETRARLAEVESIIEAVKPQMPAKARVAASLGRILQPGARA